MDESNNSNPETTQTDSLFGTYEQSHAPMIESNKESFFEDLTFQSGICSDVEDHNNGLSSVQLGGNVTEEDIEVSQKKFQRLEDFQIGVLCILALSVLIALWGVPELFAFIRRKHPEWNLPDVKDRYKMRHVPYVLDGTFLRPCTQVESTLLSEFIWDKVAFDTKRNRVLRLDKAKINAHAFEISFEGDRGVFTLISIVGDVLMFQNKLGVIKYLRCPTTEEVEMMRIAEGVNRG